MGKHSKPLIEVNGENGQGLDDFADTIMHQCVCGSNFWLLAVCFDDYEIAGYGTDMECVNCSRRAKAPTPVDHPNYVR